MTTVAEQKTKETVEFKFHHLHFYCDDLKPTEETKKWKNT